VRSNRKDNLKWMYSQDMEEPLYFSCVQIMGLDICYVGLDILIEILVD